MPRIGKLLLCLGIGWPGPAFGQAFPEGDWVIWTRPGALSGEIEAAIDAVAGEISVLIRPVAREILHRVTRPCERIAIRREGSAIAIGCDGLTPAVAVPGAGPTPYTGRDGRTHTVTIDVTDTGLRQRFDTSRGARTSTFTLRDDTLHVSVRLDSPQLPRPVQYRVQYK